MLALGLLLVLSSTYGIIVPDCLNSHGMENGDIPNSAITASSFRPWHDPWRGRLNNVKSKKNVASWCSDDVSPGQWIQVDLGKKVLTTKIATQGRSNSTAKKFVALYTVAYSDNGVNFTFYKEHNTDKIQRFLGNLNNEDIVENAFDNPIAARYIRIYPKVHVGSQICMRLDLYGCDGAQCSDNKGGCSHSCYQVSDLVVKCDCPVGYELQEKKNCTNINECQRGTAYCNQECTDTEGSYVCSCRPGYRMESNKVTCTNIDECLEETDNCSQRCIDKPGGFDCACFAGFRDIGGGLCEDIDECTEQDPGCSHTCKNNDGSYLCTCPTGYKVGLDKKTCDDIDECTTSADCDQICTNTNGSYICSCRGGFRLGSDNHKCENINECAEQTPCDLSSTDCIDNAPGYICVCKTGYEPGVTSDACKRVTCHALTLTSGTLVSPSRCSLDNSNFFEDVCTFSCSSGYAPADPNNLVVKCEANRAWNSSLPYCNRINCHALLPPANGFISPTTCATSGAKYGDNCQFSCQNGYKLVGPSSVVCQNDLSYYPKLTSTCQADVADPWITCPSNINVNLAIGEDTAKVTDQWQDPTSNVAKITIRPSNINKDYAFPAGETKVTFVATNAINKEATCTIIVTVRDREPPEIDCPPNQFVTTTLDKVVVTWPEPIAKDNVGLASLTSLSVNGQEMSPGTYSVSYIAKDAAGNSGSCGFNIYIKKKECRVEDLRGLENCFKNCQTGNWVFCNANAASDRVFAYYPGPWGAFSSCTAGVWSPEVLPDCVQFKIYNSTTGCPAGTTRGSNADDDKCLNCPIGKYNDVGTKSCVDCPADTYQSNEGSTSCLACPSDTTTGGKTGVRTKDDCYEKCKIGRYSSSGYNDFTTPCQLCPLNRYQDEVGKTLCKKCPLQYITRQNGSSKASDCGLPATISYLHPNGNATTTQKMTISFICKAEADPEPVIEWKKIKPTADGFGGVVKQTKMYNSEQKLLGIKYTITGVTEHDAGYYQCSVANSYGAESRKLYLKVNRDLSS